MIDRTMRGSQRMLAALVMTATLVVAACGGSTPAASSGGAGSTPAASSGGGGGGGGGPLTGKRLCEIVTLERATEVLGEPPPRGEASDDRLAKSHTCAYKPGPKLILQIQVTDGVGTDEQFESAIKLLTERTPVEGIGEKAYFIPRTEPPIGTRLYFYARGVMILVNIGREDVPMSDLETTARDLAAEIVASI